MSGERPPRTRDLRTPALGAAAWVGALLGLYAPAFTTWCLVALPLASLGWVFRTRRGSRSGRRLTATTGAAVLVLLAVALSALAREHRLTEGPVAALAADRAAVQVTLTTTSDPRPASGGFEQVVVVRGTVTRIEGRGRAWRVRTPVVALGGQEWLALPLGASVDARGRLAPADGDAAALLRADGAPRVVARPDVWWRGAAVVRAGIREAVAPRPEDQRVLVPSLVVGDDAGLDPALAEDFRTTGLTHLLAVSGTNLTLLVGFLLLLARLLGVRGRALHVVGALGIVGFVLLARTEPSVVRAATMGSVALFALTRNGRSRGIRTLGVAVVVLLLWDPWLAVTPGFALSVLATAGILLLAPDWRDAMARWLPRWAAEAVAVPAAAQLACTPVVAALSGEVSLVAVLANLLVAPAVAPATVLGLAGGLCAVVWPGLGQLVAWPAALAVGWIIAVARWGAGLAVPAVAWGTGALSLALLTLLCVLLALAAPRLLARAVPTTALATLCLLVVTTRPPVPGWPPEDWVLAACDVGQGDALVLRAGPASGLVVDVGPEPRAVDACLDRLGVEQVPLLVLTHFHADHVDGLPGALAGRRVGRVEVSPFAAPYSGVHQVAEQLSGVAASPQVGPHLLPRTVGDVTLEQVWPPPGTAAAPTEDGSGANDASVVLLAEVGGVRVLLTGDVEPPAQAGLARLLPGLRVDVLKVPHHGSRHQDERFLTGLGARLALVSVGADNDYGHPSPDLLRLLERSGTAVLRTDTAGDLVVAVRDGDLVTASTH